MLETREAWIASIHPEDREELRAKLLRRRLGDITTEIKPAPEYYYAEDPHQQYLAKNPFGYRCHANTGVKFPA